MKNMWGNHKKRICWIALWLCVFLCAGCGTTDESKNAMESEISHVYEEDEKTIAKNPTIKVDDPLNENMAGVLQDAAKGVIVQIRMNQVGGSGVIWKMEEDQIVIITAAHVLANNTGVVQVTFADGYQVESSEYIMQNSADIAFVYIPLVDIPVEHMNEYYQANVDKNKYDEVRNGDIVITIGSVSGPGEEAYEGKLIENWIWVEDFQQYMMIAKLEADAGMSGGGVFDDEGYFLGILCGINEEGESAVLPLVIIESIYQSVNN